MVNSVKTIETMVTVLPYVASCLVILASLYGAFFVYLPSFERLMKKRGPALLKIASQPDCLQGALLSGETLWMLTQLAKTGDAHLQKKLSRKEYLFFKDRVKELRLTLDAIGQQGYIFSFQSQLEGCWRSVRAVFRKVISQNVDHEIALAYNQAYRHRAVWEEGLEGYRVISPVIDFADRCLALAKAVQAQVSSLSYLADTRVSEGQLLLVEGQLCRVTRRYRTDYGEDSATWELELYFYEEGLVRYLRLPAPFNPARFYLSEYDLKGLEDKIPNKVVVLSDGIMGVPRGDEGSYGIFGEVHSKTTEQQVILSSKSGNVCAVRLYCWTGAGDMVSAFGFEDGRRSVVYERKLKPITDFQEPKLLLPPIMVVESN